MENGDSDDPIPLTAQQIREMRARCVERGDFSEWKQSREAVYAAESSSGQDSTTDGLDGGPSAEEIRAVRARCAASGDWAEWRQMRTKLRL